MLKRGLINPLYFLLLTCLVFGTSASFAKDDDQEDHSKYFKKLDSLSNNTHKFSYEKEGGSGLLKLQKRLNVRKKKKKKEKRHNNKINKDKKLKDNIFYRELFTKAFSKYSEESSKNTNSGN